MALPLMPPAAKLKSATTDVKTKGKERYQLTYKKDQLRRDLDSAMISYEHAVREKREYTMEQAKRTYEEKNKMMQEIEDKMYKLGHIDDITTTEDWITFPIEVSGRLRKFGIVKGNLDILAKVEADLINIIIIEKKEDGTSEELKSFDIHQKGIKDMHKDIPSGDWYQSITQALHTIIITYKPTWYYKENDFGSQAWYLKKADEEFRPGGAGFFAAQDEFAHYQSKHAGQTKRSKTDPYT